MTTYGPSIDFPGWSPAEVNALRLTSTFENGRPLDFGGLTGDFDGCGCSFGLLQWNIGSESLQPLLAEFSRDYPDRFAAIFSEDASAVTAVLHMRKVQHEDACTTRKSADALQSTHPALAWAKTINDYGHRPPQLVSVWAEHFKQLSEDPGFRRIEIRSARKVIDRAEQNARELGLRSERGLALMVDCVTQNGMGWIDRPRPPHQSRRELIRQRRDELETSLGRKATETEFMEVIARVVASTLGRPEYAADVLRRRMTIASGTGRVHGQQFDLAADFQLTEAPWETGGSSAPASPPAQPNPAPLAAGFAQLPAAGQGFYSYSARDRQFGRPDVIQALVTVATTWLHTYPASPRIGIGDISFESGGEMPPHVSHRDGADADLRPVRMDGREEPVTYNMEGQYSRALTQSLVSTLRSSSPVPIEHILFNDPGVEGVQRWAGHDNHLHVRFGRRRDG
jgi:hypothetical protein